MKRIIFGVIAAASLAHASVVTYVSRASFEAAVTNPTTFDFNQPGGPIASLGGVLSISTVGGDANGTVVLNALCGSSGGSLDCIRPLLFTFTTPGGAFGFDALTLTPGEQEVVTVSFSNADPSQTFTFGLGGQPILTPIFFGLTSTVGISTVEIYSQSALAAAQIRRINGVDNVTIAGDMSDTPEPASWTMVGLGLAGLGFAKSRRRRV